MKVLIADSMDNFSQSFLEALSDTYDVAVVKDGDEALCVAKTFRPDVAVLDTDLQNKDGFFILQTLQNTGMHPSVMMLTSLLSDYVVNRAESLGVRYLMRRPCDEQSLLSAINSLCAYTCTESYPKVCPETEKLLLPLGFRSNLKSFQYVVVAVEQLSQHKVYSYTKELYPGVARLFNGTWQQVERGIRCSIIDAWENRDEAIWKRYFATGKNGKVPKPTSSMFLSRMAECLKEQQIAK